MKKTIILTLFIFNAILVSSQIEKVKECGTEINSSNIEVIRQINKEWRSKKEKNLYNKSFSGTTHFVPVQIHIIRESGGYGGISTADAITAFNRLNKYFINANIHFFQCSPIKYIDSDTYYNHDIAQMNALDTTYSVANVLNIYVANTVTKHGKPLCGIGAFPGGLDFVMLRTSCMKNGSTLAHEVGHYFGLYHTHETNFGHEAVNGFDCTSEGDFFCDTPADPKLKAINLNSAGCVYYGVETDENGEGYSPSVTNFMSYTAHGCGAVFTEEQYQKIFWVLQNRRAYLTCTTPVLESFFYISEEETCESSKTFSFYNASEGNITNYSWNFGDGIGTSSLESPNYTYSNNGIYNVSLIVGDGSSTKTYTETIVVGAVSVPYTNDFEEGVSSLDQFTSFNSMKNKVIVHPSAAENGTYGLLFDGTETSSSKSPYFQTPTVSFAFENLWNLYYKATAKLCVDASNITNLQLEFDKKQIRNFNDNHTNFRITVNETMVGNVYQVNNTNTDDPAFTHVTIDLSAYDGQVITIGFEGTHKYNKNNSGVNNGTATFIDNINITGTDVLSIIDFNKLPLINIYPNPTKNIVTLKSNKKELEYLLITNVLGQDLTNQIIIKKINDKEITIDLTRLNAGVYYIKTKTVANKVYKK